MADKSNKASYMSTRDISSKTKKSITYFTSKEGSSSMIKKDGKGTIQNFKSQKEEHANTLRSPNKQNNSITNIRQVKDGNKTNYSIDKSENNKIIMSNYKKKGEANQNYQKSNNGQINYTKS